MSKKYFDPDTQGVHPLRLTMSSDDYDRISLALENEDTDNVTTEELDAMQDILYDAIVTKLQNTLGVSTLQ